MKLNDLKKKKCVCTGFVLQYEGGCQCGAEIHNSKVKNWTKKWPDKEGWYWVYGSIYKDEKFELSMMKVMLVGPKLDTVMYVREGNFYYPSEAGPVMFQKIEEPDIP